MDEIAKLRAEVADLSAANEKLRAAVAEHTKGANLHSAGMGALWILVTALLAAGEREPHWPQRLALNIAALWERREAELLATTVSDELREEILQAMLRPLPPLVWQQLQPLLPDAGPLQPPA